MNIKELRKHILITIEFLELRKKEFKTINCKLDLTYIDIQINVYKDILKMIEF